MGGKLFGRALKAEVVAQCLTGVLGTESAAALKDRHDVINERRKFMRQCRSHKCEAVDGPRVLPGNHVVGELLGSADELCPSRAPLVGWVISRNDTFGRARASA